MSLTQKSSSDSSLSISPAASARVIGDLHHRWFLAMRVHQQQDSALDIKGEKKLQKIPQYILNGMLLCVTDFL